MEDRKNIHQKIHDIMRDVTYIRKCSKKVNGQYGYVPHDDVAAIFHKSFVEHGVLAIPSVIEITQDGNRTAIILEVTFANVDRPSDAIKVQYPGYGVDNSDKGVGKAISYAFKYCLLKTFCLETGDDVEKEAQSRYLPKDQIKKDEANSKTPLTKVKKEVLEKWLESSGITWEMIEKEFGKKSAADICDEELKELAKRIRQKWGVRNAKD